MSSAARGLPEQGLPAEAIAAALTSFKAGDLEWKRGTVWGYIYPVEPEIEAVGKAAYMDFLTENALDPTVFPSVMVLENRIVRLACDHLQGGPDASGNFTSGGTESILLACKTARDYARAVRPEVTRPAIVLPITAHAAFHKAAHYLGLDVIRVPVDPDTFRATGEAVAAAITDQTVLVVASSPSYAHGVVDDVVGIAAAAQARGVPCHVDGCVGAWLLPFFRELGEDIPPFDFSVPGVSSISMDLHKYAFCPKGASLVLYADKAYRAHQFYACAGWTGYTVVNATVQSTKTGGPVAAAWATLHAFGREGYLAKARALLGAHKAIVEGVGRIDGIRMLGTPEMCMGAFASDDPRVNVFHIADEMKQRGWYVQPQLGIDGYPQNIHLSVNPGVSDQVAPMLASLAESVEAARALSEAGPADALRAALSTMDLNRLDGAAFDRLLAGAGIEGADLPERMAGINDLLQALPFALREQLLIRFFNDLNHGDALERAGR